MGCENMHMQTVATGMLMALGTQTLIQAIFIKRSKDKQLQMNVMRCYLQPLLCNHEELTCRVSREGSRRECTSVTAAMCITCSAHVVQLIFACKSVSQRRVRRD